MQAVTLGGHYFGMAHPGAPKAPVPVRPAEDGAFNSWLALYEAVAAERLWMGAEAPLDAVARRQAFDRALTQDDAVIFLAEADGRLVGAVNLFMGGGVVDLGMFVDREFRGRGVGGALVEAAIVWSRESGAHKIALAVWAHNLPARGLYAKYGFETEGIRRRHYRRRNGELWDAVLMGLVLDQTTPGGPDPDSVAPAPSPRTR